MRYSNAKSDPLSSFGIVPCLVPPTLFSIHSRINPEKKISGVRVPCSFAQTPRLSVSACVCITAVASSSTAGPSNVCVMTASPHGAGGLFCCAHPAKKSHKEEEVVVGGGWRKKGLVAFN